MNKQQASVDVLEGNRSKVRKEVHSRMTFAYNCGAFWFNKIGHILKSGNIFSSKDTHKWIQSRRIYIHYQNEFQRCKNLPLSK